jgi:hypothetical protein
MVVLSHPADSCVLESRKIAVFRFILEQPIGNKASFHLIPVLDRNNSVSPFRSLVHFIDNESVNTMIRNLTNEKADQHETSLRSRCGIGVSIRSKRSCI